MPYNSRQKAALIQALSSLLDFRAGGLGPAPGRRFPLPGLVGGRPVVPPDKGFIPIPVVPRPGLTFGRPSAEVPSKGFFPIPGPVPPPGLGRGRGFTGGDKGFIPIPVVPRPGLGGRDDVVTRNPSGIAPRNPGGDYRAF